ncbi:MAG TPA: hypothetical protein VFV67_33575 [Actinophytocola sp.]|uniref:hypothetical protein n=1 Tax=Actinophytocola sp. TaxID=1872138 RepID=UPI002DBBCFAD|nr:hypothetical protein [Actinophytocola sp.]HEU5475599.1 hypothetical protein [Actinophytocola sp.]
MRRGDHATEPIRELAVGLATGCASSAAPHGDRVAVETGLDDVLRSDYDSPALHIATRPSEETIGRVRSFAGRDDVRYYLAAGSPGFHRPLWSMRPWTGSARVPRWGPGMAGRVLSGADERSAAVEREIELTERWLGTGTTSPRLLVTEVFGRPNPRDVRFWQTCLTRLGRRRLWPPRLLVLRHECAPAGPVRDGASDRQDEQILIALLLAGGYAWRPEFDRWTARLGWTGDRIDAMTSVRDCPEETLYTYRDAHRWAQARAAHAAAGRETVAELAAVVVTAAPNPLVATAALATDPAVILAACKGSGFAEAEPEPGELLRYGRTLFRASRAGGWAAVPRGTAGAVYLATLVAGLDEVSPAVAELALDSADRLGIEPDVRAQLAYQLGLVLARGHTAQAWAASARCFAAARETLAATPKPDPETTGDRVAAAFNGAALAAYRAGDHAEAVRAELAALDALGGSGRSSVVEHRVLILANLATVYGREPDARERALAAFRQAWRLAAGAGSLTGMGYVASGMVPALIEAGGHAEAEDVTNDLLRHYDATPAPPRAVERALVASCWRLADVRLAAGAVRTAAGWYVTAVRRMRRAAPGVVRTVLRDLNAEPPDGCPGFAREVLTEELAAHITLATDLAALSSFVEGGERDGRG